MPIRAPQIVFPVERTVAIETTEVPDPAPRQIRVRATKTLISAGTERNMFEGDRPSVGVYDDAGRLLPGYSWVGAVDATGPDVDGYAVGDRIVTELGHQGGGLIGLDPDGSPESMHADRIPAEVSDEQATFVALGDVALHGVRRAAPSIGDAVAVFGQGVVGQLITQFARMAGAHPIIAVDLIGERLERAETSGATHTVNPTHGDVARAVCELTAGEGARVVFMATRTPKPLPDCLRACASGGTVALTGAPLGTVELTLRQDLFRREVDIIGTYQDDYPRRPYHRFRWPRAENRRYVLDLMRRDELHVQHLISHQVPYHEAPAMYDMIERGPEGWLGVLLDWEDPAIE